MMRKNVNTTVRRAIKRRKRAEKISFGRGLQIEE